ncbi:MAG: shikimate kinase [Flavobacteriales bacterium]
MSMDKRIFFIGYMGAGKTHAARALSGYSGLSMADTDEMVEIRANQSIEALFREQGEEAFRKLESHALEEVLKSDASIVSCGGGLVCNPSQRRAIYESGHVIWLDPPIESLLPILRTESHRPLLKEIANEDFDQHVRDHFSNRKACYSLHHERFSDRIDEVALERWASMIQ